MAGAIGGSADKDIAHRDVTPNNFGHSVGRGYLFDFSAGKVLCPLLFQPCLCYQDISAAQAVTPCHPWKAVWPTCILFSQACKFCKVTPAVPSQYCVGMHGVLQLCFCAQDMASNGWQRPRSANSLSSITGTVLWAPLAVLEGEQHSESSMLEGLFISSLSISCNGKLAGRHAMRPSQLKLCARLRRGQLTRLELDELPNIAPHLKPLILPLHDLFYPKALPQGFPLKARTYNTEVTRHMVQALCKSVSFGLDV